MSEDVLLILSNKEKNSDNCVKWARERVTSLPFGLFTLEDKKKIINSKKAKPGNIAIIKTGQKEGHVAIVVKVDDEKLIIKEANFKAGKITERHGTEKKLNIIGYFEPNKKGDKK